MPKGLRPVVVTVSDDMLGDIHRLADRLAAKGMRVHRVMPVTGVITGSYDSGEMSALEGVNGVASVEEEASAHLPTPDSALQ